MSLDADDEMARYYAETQDRPVPVLRSPVQLVSNLEAAKAAFEALQAEFPTLTYDDEDPMNAEPGVLTKHGYEKDSFVEDDRDEAEEDDEEEVDMISVHSAESIRRKSGHDFPTHSMIKKLSLTSRLYNPMKSLLDMKKTTILVPDPAAQYAVSRDLKHTDVLHKFLHIHAVDFQTTFAHNPDSIHRTVSFSDDRLKIEFARHDLITIFNFLKFARHEEFVIVGNCPPTQPTLGLGRYREIAICLQFGISSACNLRTPIRRGTNKPMKLFALAYIPFEHAQRLETSVLGACFGFSGSSSRAPLAEIEFAGNTQLIMEATTKSVPRDAQSHDGDIFPMRNCFRKVLYRNRELPRPNSDRRVRHPLPGKRRPIRVMLTWRSFRQTESWPVSLFGSDYDEVPADSLIMIGSSYNRYSRAITSQLIHNLFRRGSRTRSSQGHHVYFEVHPSEDSPSPSKSKASKKASSSSTSTQQPPPTTPKTLKKGRSLAMMTPLLLMSAVAKFLDLEALDEEFEDEDAGLPDEDVFEDFISLDETVPSTPDHKLPTTTVLSGAKGRLLRQFAEIENRYHSSSSPTPSELDISGPSSDTADAESLAEPDTNEVLNQHWTDTARIEDDIAALAENTSGTARIVQQRLVGLRDHAHESSSTSFPSSSRSLRDTYSLSQFEQFLRSQFPSIIHRLVFRSTIHMKKHAALRCRTPSYTNWTGKWVTIRGGKHDGDVDTSDYTAALNSNGKRPRMSFHPRPSPSLLETGRLILKQYIKGTAIMSYTKRGFVDCVYSVYESFPGKRFLDDLQVVRCRRETLCEALHILPHPHALFLQSTSHHIHLHNIPYPAAWRLFKNDLVEFPISAVVPDDDDPDEPLPIAPMTLTGRIFDIYGETVEIELEPQFKDWSMIEVWSNKVVKCLDLNEFVTVRLSEEKMMTMYRNACQRVEHNPDFRLTVGLNTATNEKHPEINPALLPSPLPNAVDASSYYTGTAPWLGTSIVITHGLHKGRRANVVDVALSDQDESGLLVQCVLYGETTQGSATFSIGYTHVVDEQTGWPLRVARPLSRDVQVIWANSKAKRPRPFVVRPVVYGSLVEIRIREKAGCNGKAVPTQTYHPNIQAAKPTNSIAGCVSVVTTKALSGADFNITQPPRSASTTTRPAGEKDRDLNVRALILDEDLVELVDSAHERSLNEEYGARRVGTRDKVDDPFLISVEDFT
ncbi:hypothetical protein BDZ89DRAFT_1048398 [Hymenopellis radicata]|nr:hypothetical protein BDZ89DRAFT_1048398 [Hymenopellis radicata]